MPEIDYSLYSPFSYREGLWLASMPHSNDLSVGESTLARREIISSGVTTANQVLRLTYFTARKSEIISQINIPSGATAAGATPTLIRMGIYSVADNGDLTLVASTANDITLFAASSTEYLKALESPFVKNKGQRYAFGLLVRSAAAFPTFYGQSTVLPVTMFAEPKLASSISAQLDLPSSVANASLVSSSASIYASLLP